jgi:hypothetical protein
VCLESTNIKASSYCAWAEGIRNTIHNSQGTVVGLEKATFCRFVEPIVSGYGYAVQCQEDGTWSLLAVVLRFIWSVPRPPHSANPIWHSSYNMVDGMAKCACWNSVLVGDHLISGNFEDGSDKHDVSIKFNVIILVHYGGRDVNKGCTQGHEANRRFPFNDPTSSPKMCSAALISYPVTGHFGSNLLSTILIKAPVLGRPIIRWI